MEERGVGLLLVWLLVWLLGQHLWLPGWLVGTVGGKGAKAGQGQSNPLRGFEEGLLVEVGGEELEGRVIWASGLEDGGSCYDPRRVRGLS
eukprot:1032626-Pelagomonas_calceolata.AAC.2